MSYSQLFWITSCYLSGCLLISFKKNSTGFELNMFSANILTRFFWEIFLSFTAFRREEKIGITLCKDSWISGWYRKYQLESNIFSCMIFAECSLGLSLRSTIFLQLTSAWCYLRKFASTRCSCWKYKSASSVWLGFKDSK